MKSNLSVQISRLLIIGLALLLLSTFISCMDDLVAPRLDQEDKDKNKDDEEPDIEPDPPAMSSQRLRLSAFLV